MHIFEVFAHSNLKDMTYFQNRKSNRTRRHTRMHSYFLDLLESFSEALVPFSDAPVPFSDSHVSFAEALVRFLDALLLFREFNRACIAPPIYKPHKHERVLNYH